MTKREIKEYLERRIKALKVNVDLFGEKAKKDYDGYFTIYYAECEKLNELEYILKYIVKGVK